MIRKDSPMRNRSPLSMELKDELLRRGYPAAFCDAITENLNTDFTAKRMLGYLKNNGRLPMEEIADEMLCILADRQRIMEKMETERANAAWNQYMAEGFGEEDSDE